MNKKYNSTPFEDDPLQEKSTNNYTKLGSFSLH